MEKRSANINQKSNRIIVQWLVLLTLSMVLISTQAQALDNTNQVKEPLKVGFVLFGPASDYCWNYMHDQGRRYMEAKLHGKVTTVTAENVPENDQAERIMEKMIAQGCKVIFATSFGYLESVLHVADRHPDVKFMQAHREATRSNLGSYFYYSFQPMYVSGVVAGHITQSDKVGYIACRPLSDAIQNINAFTLGIQTIKPKATVKVVWTNTWSDAPLESEACRSLIERGVDVIAYEPGTPTTVAQIAESNKIYVVGGLTDVHQCAPKYWLTGAWLNWGPFYTRVVESVLNNTWKSGVYICDAKNDSVKLSTFGPAVTPELRKEANGLMNKIKDGELIVFKGPLKDSTGKARLATGKTPDFHWLSQMNFFVPGVDGNLPKN